MTFKEKCKIARGRNTSAEVFVTLSRDEDADVRYWVARNINTPWPVLNELSEDEDSYVRQVAKETIKKKSRPRDWKEI
jgi:hypothetical protein